MAEKQGPPPEYKPYVAQPVVAPPQQNSGLLSDIGRSLNQIGNDVSKAVDDLTVGIVDKLRPGNVVEIQSKLCGNSLRIVENGTVDCSSRGGLSCQFFIIQGQKISNTIRLQNVAMPQYFLAINGGFLIGYGRGGDDCEFFATFPDAQSVIFESAREGGSHIGVLPSGQITSPAQTSKATNASHFYVKFIRKGR